LLPDGRTIEFTLTTEAITPFVFLNLLDHKYGWFSENGFILTTPTKTLTYTPYKDPLTVEQFQQQLYVMSLYDVAKFITENPGRH
jgi:hypothetical protein